MNGYNIIRRIEDYRVNLLVCFRWECRVNGIVFDVNGKSVLDGWDLVMVNF